MVARSRLMVTAYSRDTDCGGVGDLLLSPA
jgi:hypothetical protein